MVLHVHLEDRAGLRIHRRLPQLIRVHLAEPLVALDVDAAATQALHGLVSLLVVEGVDLLRALPHAIERRLRDVDLSRIDQLAHPLEEEGQKQCPDVTSVDVSVRIRAGQAADSGDEIFVLLNGEIVDEFRGWIDGTNLLDFEGDQICRQSRIEPLPPFRCADTNIDFRTALQAPPDRSQCFQIVFRDHLQDPPVLSSDHLSSIDHADGFVRRRYGEGRNDSQRGEQISQTGRDVPRSSSEAEMSACEGSVTLQVPLHE